MRPFRRRRRLVDERVDGSIEEVTVPEDVPPGGSFTVHVWGKRKGERVAIAHKLWRASGQQPRVQRRVCNFGCWQAKSVGAARHRKASDEVGARSVITARS